MGKIEREKVKKVQAHEAPALKIKQSPRGTT